MAPSFVIFLVGLAVSIIAGLAVFKYGKDRQDQTVAFIMGIVTACLGALVGIGYEVTEFRKEQNEMLRGAVPTIQSPVWRSLVDEIVGYDRRAHDNRFETILVEPLRLAISKNIHQAFDGVIEFSDRAEVVEVTSYLLSKADKAVFATSYINPDEWWTTSFSATYQQTVGDTKKKISGRFARVFIVGSSEEGRRLKPVMETQAKAGVEVKCVCEGAIPNSKRLDFIVIDSEVAGVLVLDDNRHFKLGRFYSTPTMAQDYDRQFSALWLEAVPWSQADQLHCSSKTIGQ